MLYMMALCPPRCVEQVRACKRSKKLNKSAKKIWVAQGSSKTGFIVTSQPRNSSKRIFKLPQFDDAAFSVMLQNGVQKRKNPQRNPFLLLGGRKAAVRLKRLLAFFCFLVPVTVDGNVPPGLFHRQSLGGRAFKNYMS
jgi:hypothetical protein